MIPSQAEVVVDLDARDLDEGPLPIWTNVGSLGDSFVASGNPTIKAIDGVKGVTYSGSDWHVGPRSTPEMDGSSDRSIQVWLYNPVIAAEETVVSWGHRGGPDGSNMSFNHGTHNAFGAVGHWGNGPDIGWDPSVDDADEDTGEGQEEAGVWTNIAYTQTGNETRVFTNGILTKREEIDINTHPNQSIVIAAQQTAADSNAFTIGGTLTIATVQIWDSALPDGQIAFNYNQEASNFGRDLAPITDSDGDGLPDDLEQAVGLNPNVADADGDRDGDGVSNVDELGFGSDLTSDDTDGDGVKDGEEVAAGTSLTSADTDGDSLSDKDELDAGTDPTQTDTDGDGAPDNVELNAGTDPNDAASSPNTIILLRDATTAENWDTPALWSTGEGVQPNQNYVISPGAGSLLRSPKDAASFPEGAVLSLSSPSANLELRSRDTVHFDDLRWQGGSLSLGSSQGGLTGNVQISGDVTVTLEFGQRFFFGAALSGEGNLTFDQDLDTPSVVRLTGTGATFSGNVRANSVMVEFGGLNPLGTAHFGFVEGGMRLLGNVLMPESTLSLGGVNFRLEFNGYQAVFRALQGINEDGDVLFELPAGVYDRETLLAAGFNEETVPDSEGALIILGDELDADGDGLWDAWEEEVIGNLDQTADSDEDGDGLSAADEFRLGGNPGAADSDGDGVPDGQEAELGSNLNLVDSDGDTLSDGEEVNRQVNGQPAPTDPSRADTDGDRLNDNVETNTGTFVSLEDTGTDPLVADTDGGGWPDGAEVTISETDPHEPGDDPDIPPGVKVLLDAENLPEGELTNWPNVGELGGEFVAEEGNPEVELITGVKGVTFSGGLMRGPVPSEDLVANSARTIEAWVFNSTIDAEETVVSWGRRGGPNGTNISFNHGTHNAFGAIGHWGGTGPDIGWDPESQDGDADTGTGEEEANAWTFIAYTYDPDQTLTSVYTNGQLTNTEDISSGAGNEGALNTWAEDDAGNPLNILLASQNDANGAPTADLRGSLSIGLLRVYTGALEGSQIAANFNREAARFGRNDSDGDGLSDTWELDQFGDLAQSGDGDPDGDGLDNRGELALSTDPNEADTDGDGFSDGDEVAAFTDPLDPDDFPKAAELLVELDATGLDPGGLDTWQNTGQLGDFAAAGSPEVIEVDGVRGVNFDGVDDYFEGPNSVEAIEGRSPRTIEAWVHNPTIDNEETVVSWGHRGGPEGSNMSFNHGANDAFGAVGHWGAPDLGWNGQQRENEWSYIAYTYDGNMTAVYTNGLPSNSENVTLNTHDGNAILIAAQRDSDQGAVTGGLRGSMTIAKIRIHDGALSDSDILTNFNADAAPFGLDPIPVGGELPNLLVHLDAEEVPGGPISVWENTGTLDGDFNAEGDPTVETIDGAKGVTLDGEGDWLVGPTTPASLEGGSPRTIEAWVFNPEVAAEETVVSWGRRGGPDGSNVSFNHGNHNTFGAVGHWGASDIGWEDQEEANIWTHITYTQDGSTTRVYTNGQLTNAEEGVTLSTHGGQGIVVGAQWDDETTVNEGLSGQLSVGLVRIYDGALSDEQVAASFRSEAERFGRADTDSDGLPDRWEMEEFGNLDFGPGDDPDGDGLDNATEQSLDTRGNVADSDGDGANDGEEVAAFTDPLDAEDFPAPRQLVVDLDATGLELGAVAEWVNHGSLGNFTAGGDPEVIEVDGVRGIDFDGTNDYFEGPVTIPTMEGRSPRSIEAWIHNPEIASEETVVSWGHRGGPDGTNLSFNHGTHNAFGAVGHWGNGPDVGWDPSATADDEDTGQGQEEANLWTYIAYTYDGSATTVYTNGQVTTSEAMVLDTHAGNAILVAAQRDSNQGPVTGGLRGDLTIAKIRIHDGALSADEVAAGYSGDALQFGRDPLPGFGDASDLVVTSVTRNAVGELSISIGTAPGQDYTVQYSEDLQAWTDIDTINGDGNPATFTDTDAIRTARASGYYRILESP